MIRNRTGTFADSGGRRNRGGAFGGGGSLGGGDDGGGIISRGSLPPGLITDDALNGAALSTKHVRFHRQGFAYDGNNYTSLSVHDNTGWSRVGQSANSLLLQLGSFEDAFVAWVWGSFAWGNNDANNFTGQAAICLYQGEDTDDDGIADTWNAYQRTENLVNLYLPNDNNLRTLNPFAQIVVPAIDAADWWIGMQCQMSGATGATSSQRHRHQSLMAYTSALDPELDANLIDDAGLS